MPPLALPPDAIHVWRLRHDRAAGRRGLLRVLASYAHASPQELRLVEGHHGRPQLASPYDHLHFNWSHSGDVALVAIATGLPRLGIDLELVRRPVRSAELARRYYSAAESAQLAKVPASCQLRAFLQFWTAKESVLKAYGHGISYGLHRVEFSLSDGEVRPLRFEGAIGPAHTWCLRPLDAGPDVIAHLAWQGRQRNIRCFEPERSA